VSDALLQKQRFLGNLVEFSNLKIENKKKKMATIRKLDPTVINR
jgi:hypothetical protein